ncbi:MAG: dipeptidase [Alphaproteobacteria bacterium]|nr:dipeptidase [Alphaproteobacteria bacterium]
MTDPLALHRSLLTLDSHIDIPWPGGPPFAAETHRRVDLPKMRRGHLVAGCFAAYVPQGRRTNEGHESAFARAVAMLQAIRNMAGGEAQLCVRAADVAAAWRAGGTAVVPAVENGYVVGSDPARLRALAEHGARYLTLTHNGHNALADSAIPRPELGDAAEEHGGLSALGRAVIAEMNALGMLVDVSHASKAAMLAAVAGSRTPVVASHSCVHALCPHPRNLDDAQLDALAQVGGVVQITAVPQFLRSGGKPETVGVADFADHVEYAVRRIGLEHVGISSDFDGGGGIRDWRDAAESPTITAELVRRGFDAGALAALWGGNFLRLLAVAEQGAA